MYIHDIYIYVKYKYIYIYVHNTTTGNISMVNSYYQNTTVINMDVNSIDEVYLNNLSENIGDMGREIEMCYCTQASGCKLNT